MRRFSLPRGSSCHGRVGRFNGPIAALCILRLEFFAVDNSLDTAIPSSVYAIAVRRLFSSCSSCCCVLAFLARGAWLHDSPPALPRRALCGVVIKRSVGEQREPSNAKTRTDARQGSRSGSTWPYSYCIFGT
ncbi:hypothetical protein GQ600_12365 [Phytophthora cactorum]|nr:hypothetical protein GQ600_12365 [Phytophthora cactorum]